MESDVFKWCGRELRVEHKTKARAGEPASRGKISLARQSLPSPIFFKFLLPGQCQCIVKTCAYIPTCLTAHRLYVNYRRYQITIQCDVFTQIGAVRSVDWIFIIEAPAWRWPDEYEALDRSFYSLLFKQEMVAAHSYRHILLLTAFFYEEFIRNTIIMVSIKFIITICMNNNAGINHN